MCPIGNVATRRLLLLWLVAEYGERNTDFHCWDFAFTALVTDRVDWIVPKQRRTSDDCVGDDADDVSLRHDMFLLSPLRFELRRRIIHVENPDLPRSLPHEHRSVEYQSATCFWSGSEGQSELDKRAALVGEFRLIVRWVTSLSLSLSLLFRPWSIFCRGAFEKGTNRA
jgi:hypothetical protein